MNNKTDLAGIPKAEEKETQVFIMQCMPTIITNEVIMIQIIITVLAGAMLLFLLHRGLTYVLNDIVALIEVVKSKYNEMRGKK